MGDARVNSKLKTTYAMQVAELASEFKSKLVASCEDIFAQANNIRTKVTDNVYNNIAEITNMLIACANNVVRSTDENLITPLTKDKVSGDALNAECKAVSNELQNVYHNAIEIEKIPASVISGRGLDENYTDATKAQFGDACAAFISLRTNFIVRLGEITAKCRDIDTGAAYQNIGAAAENITNDSAASYNKLVSQLEEVGILISKSIKEAEEAGSKVAGVENVKVTNILDSQADV